VSLLDQSAPNSVDIIWNIKFMAHCIRYNF
jgi:hypothetical protein